ncbi:hypothetical protein RU639_005390 [Aspergillus parasiticus]
MLDKVASQIQGSLIFLDPAWKSKCAVVLLGLVEFCDGKDVFAQVPNPNDGHPYFTTASEVASMQFVRDVLHIPAPKVFAWCSNASESPVGTEYLIMEKVPGVKLSHFWDDMHAKKKSQIVTQLVMFDKALASNPFPEYGSLYCAEDGPRDDNFTVDLEQLWKNISSPMHNGKKNQSFIWVTRHGCRASLMDLDSIGHLKRPNFEHWIVISEDAGNALRLRDTLVGQIAALSGSIFTDGEPIVLGYLMQVVDSFTEEERSQQREDQAKWEEGVVLMDEILDRLGAYRGWDGFVSHADYEARKRLVLDVQERFFQQVATTDDERSLWCKAWPFPVSDK